MIFFFACVIMKTARRKRRKEEKGDSEERTFHWQKKSEKGGVGMPSGLQLCAELENEQNTEQEVRVWERKGGFGGRTPRPMWEQEMPRYF